MTTFHIRAEEAHDISAIYDVTEAAFMGIEHSDGAEQDLVDKLRAAKALSLSLVAEAEGEVIGHIAASEVLIGGGAHGWFGIGPVSVRPDRQQQGVGIALMGSALDQLRAESAAGVVLLGDPGYYRRFGFEVVPGLVYPHAPAEYFMAICLNAPEFPQGIVEYHSAFGG
ncbi:GNAT family N-acetyltransferase [Corynebacterium crudilactis]|uniref:GCN5 family acetyltransferase n=1 Tax=Corynebacterium crudilactis TaxID=1652495 RepID=A0A172QX72_9CORY|nr:N-acetyltransferase [Corynebacterium crudilactis]ANE05304.1 GCN5 family acetyltransferase [Corynebacterium crudilactis]